MGIKLGIFSKLLLSLGKRPMDADSNTVSLTVLDSYMGRSLTHPVALKGEEKIRKVHPIRFQIKSSVIEILHCNYL